MSTFELVLRNTELVTVVSLIDFDRVSEHRWWLDAHGYVITSVPHPEGGLRADGRRKRRATVGLHKLIMDVPWGDPRFVDHKNRNRRDNTRGNLRVLSNRQSQQNVSPHRGSSSQYRGVSWHKAARKWEAHGTLDRRKQHLGLYDDEAQAASVARGWRLANLPFTEEVPVVIL